MNDNRIDWFYTNARFNGKTALLAGPFFTQEDAASCIDECQKLAEEKDGLAQYASYGVMRCAKFAGHGQFNAILRLMGKNIPIFDN